MNNDANLQPKVKKKGQFSQKKCFWQCQVCVGVPSWGQAIRSKKKLGAGNGPMVARRWPLMLPVMAMAMVRGREGEKERQRVIGVPLRHPPFRPSNAMQ
jgi:hypothetical protein